jgi:hypothetical protein
MSAKVCLVPVSAAPTGAERASLSRTSFGTDREGKRARSTRCKRLREGREATLPSDELRVTGAASGGAPRHLTESTVRRWPRRMEQLERTEPAVRRWSRVIEQPDRQTEGAPQLLPRRDGTEASMTSGTGNRVSVNGAGLASRVRPERRPGVRPRFAEVASFGSEPGSPGHRVKTGIARRAFGHDGRCEVERRLTPEDRPVVDRPTFRVAPGGCAGASRPHRPGLFTVLGR